MRPHSSGGSWVPWLLGAVGAAIGLFGFVLIDLRDDVLIGEPPNTGAGALGVVLVIVAAVLLGTAVLWVPLRRSRAQLDRGAELQRLDDDSRR